MNAQYGFRNFDTYTKQLLEKYKDDEQLIGLVNKTYDYFNEILSKQFLIKNLKKRETNSFHLMMKIQKENKY